MYYVPSLGNEGNADQFWTGWWDEPSEGDYADASGERRLVDGDFRPWFLGQPNGNDEENCGVNWIHRDAWNDEQCSKEYCGFCRLEEAPVLALRGGLARSWGKKS